MRIQKTDAIILRNQNNALIPSGFPSFDEQCGLRLSELILVGGEASIGKTTFVNSLAIRALNSLISSMVIVCDQTYEMYVEKINAMSREVTGDDIIRTKPLTTYENIKASIRTNAIKRNVKLFVIDYLQMLGYLRSKNESEASFYERVCRELKNLAKELEICIVLVVQFKIAQNKNGYPRPDRSRIHGGEGIVQIADTILLLYRPNYYGRQHKYRKDIPDHVTEVIIDKGRNIGGTGTFFVDYKNEMYFEYENNRRQIERYVLSVLMTYSDDFNDLFHKYQKSLSENIFYYPKHRIIFNAIKELYNKGEIPELQSVVKHLQANPVSGMPDSIEVCDISKEAITYANFPRHIEMLRAWSISQE